MFTHHETITNHHKTIRDTHPTMKHHHFLRFFLELFRGHRNHLTAVEAWLLHQSGRKDGFYLQQVAEDAPWPPLGGHTTEAVRRWGCSNQRVMWASVGNGCG